jgi:hypothetical protein
MPRHWHAAPWFLRAATCVHQHEGAWNDNTGNTYFGGLQFLESTWKRAGGAHHMAFDHPGDQRRYPFTVSPREQIYRMWIIVRQDGGSFREWGTAGACGLR